MSNAYFHNDVTDMVPAIKVQQRGYIQRARDTEALVVSPVRQTAIDVFMAVTSFYVSRRHVAMSSAIRESLAQMYHLAAHYQSASRNAMLSMIYVTIMLAKASPAYSDTRVVAVLNDAWIVLESFGIREVLGGDNNYER